MAEHYKQAYGIPSVAVIASHDRSIAQKPAPFLHAHDEVVIGMAGQFYANEEWMQLTRALNYAGWQLAGRKVRLKVLGHHPPMGEIPARNLEFIGWKSQPEVVRVLSQETDILYCPYPFTKDMDEVAKLSFPSKVPIYLAAGRPVLFHGPLYSSPGRYLAEKGAAVFCNDLYPAALYNALQKLVEDPELFKKTALCAQTAFECDFTLERMREEFDRFLEVADDGPKAGGRPALPVLRNGGQSRKMAVYAHLIRRSRPYRATARNGLPIRR